MNSLLFVVLLSFVCSTLSFRVFQRPLVPSSSKLILRSTSLTDEEKEILNKARQQIKSNPSYVFWTDENVVKLLEKVIPRKILALSIGGYRMNEALENKEMNFEETLGKIDSSGITLPRSESKFIQEKMPVPEDFDPSLTDQLLEEALQESPYLKKYLTGA